ncbi:bifunctional diguanylate cyclase/phosphodiesterase [Bradyrhizobium erythrophlei]|uniref:Diguanylate cyclase/phosphodiesterase n=1 Tax=Bradyrhizobium erythrophlei TaxID=1437360 RepID=A0A1M5RYL4_9BRAD|nr:EAL domain-containing protein [Bradyrhizobium erythrophlei]SHH31442.1 diguanylate cyclase/phosphodiesterase [Bradyrhizobium erythrophlei]
MTANGSATFNVKASVSDNPIRWLVGGGVLLIAAIAIGATIMVGNFRERALDNSKRELENTVLLLSRHFDQQLDDFGAVQNDLIAYMRSSGVDSIERYKYRMSSPEIHLMLRAKLSALSYVGGVNVFDSDGVLINSSSVWPVPAVSVADRHYFKTFKNDPQSPDMLLEPVYSRITGVWTTVIARKITGPRGEFLGVIGRGIEPANFEKFFASLALGDGAAIAMFHRDGTLLARYPHVDSLIGQNFADGPFFQSVFSKSDHGTVRTVSPVDGKDRLGAVRALSEFPIIVAATTTASAALADWRAQIWFLIVAAGLAMLVITVMLYLVVRKLSHQHRLSEQRLRLEKQRLDTAVNNMTQGLLLFASSQRLIICNQRYIDMYGLSAKVVKPGATFREVIAHRKATGSFVGDVDLYCSRVLRDIGLRQTMTIQTPDGRSIQVVNEPLADGGWVATHEDITERTRAEQRITHLAHYDALTDLPNRALFHGRLKAELANIAPGGQLAVHYIDIDEFKSVNDSLGHLIGDELLKSVAASLNRCVEASDFVARLGGDEFAIVQTAVRSTAEVTDLVERVFDAIREPFECLGHQLSTDASIGIALAPEHGVDLDQILKNADLAMYAAKSAGRRTYRFFEPEMDAQVKARRRLELDLRQAIADQALEVYYQPCVSLADNTITGCEALVRWRHPERGMISPAEFIPIAEETGLINQLGEWVLETACAEATKWPDDIRLAVNVSPVQFRSGTLALRIVAALAQSGLPASRLELEITEAVLIRDDDAALAILHQLRGIGVRIALDDFGTGYSSLSYLQRFPFDKIKIDRCFVNDIAEANGSSCIVRAVVNIATERHMTTTAEGVETRQQQELLRALGCSEMQGYLFSPAKPAAEIRRMFLQARERPAAMPPSPGRKRRRLPSTA